MLLTRFEWKEKAILRGTLNKAICQRCWHESADILRPFDDPYESVSPGELDWQIHKGKVCPMKADFACFGKQFRWDCDGCPLEIQCKEKTLTGKLTKVIPPLGCPYYLEQMLYVEPKNFKAGCHSL